MATGLSPATYAHSQPSNSSVKHRARWLVPLLLAASLSLAAVETDYSSAKEKFDRIESDQLHPGARVQLTARELNAYVAHEIPAVTDGVRNPRLELLGPSLARGTALVDFAKVRRSQGYPPSWLMTKLLEGERPVSVTARISSAAGHATIDVRQVQISGLAIDGPTLDFLIQHFLVPLYPNAIVGQPFQLDHHIDRIDVEPTGVGVVIGR
jgi:hypothetical protein